MTDPLHEVFSQFMFLKYVVMFSQWALGQGVPEVRERTTTICYEDVVDRHRADEALTGALLFLYNGTLEATPDAPNNRPWTLGPPGDPDKAADHGTASSTDPLARARLRRVVDDLDREYYGGDIRWLDSAFPC